MHSEETKRLIGITSTASRLGLTVQEYETHLKSGELWCCGCKTFHLIEAFGNDQYRPSGKAASCLVHRAKERDGSRDNSRAYFKARYERIRASRPRDRTLRSIDDIPELDIAYLAGLIDGEGCLSITKVGLKKRHMTLISIAMTHEGVMEWLAGILETPRTTVCRSIQNPHHAIQYRVQVSGKRAIRLAERCLPWLKVKNRHAEVFLRFRETFIKQGGPGVRVPEETITLRESLRHELKKLNARGIK